MTTGGLARYSRWHLYDYLREKGISTMIVVSLFAVLTYLPLRAMANGQPMSTLDRALLDRLFSGLLETIAVIGALFATNGIVSQDRKMGYHRFLFAKPLAIPAYYAQSFVIAAVGFLIVAAALLALHAVVIRPVFPPRAFLSLAVVFVGIGGVGFLFSTFWRYDWLSTVLVLTVSGALWDLYGEAGGMRGALVRLLPPAPLLDDVMGAAVSGGAFPITDALWIAGYGIVCLLLGLLHLRTRAFVTA